MVRGTRWECGYCGDFGAISSLQPSEKAKLIHAATPSVRLSITVTDSSDLEKVSEQNPEVGIQMIEYLSDTIRQHLEN